MAIVCRSVLVSKNLVLSPEVHKRLQLWRVYIQGRLLYASSIGRTASTFLKLSVKLNYYFDRAQIYVDNVQGKVVVK